MLAIVSLLVVVSVSILITRVATVALTHTGLSREAARFQARSAFTGSGFTTTESERVVNHPLRRRIVLALMLLGNAGVVTAVSSLILTFVGDGDASLTWKVVLIVTGLVALYGVSSSAWVDRRLSRWIERALDRFTDLDVQDYASLMQLGGDYRLVEMAVREGDWLAGRRLVDSRLRDEGVIVLAIHRADGAFEGAPAGDARIRAGDELVLYGRTSDLRALDERPRTPGGELEHAEAVAREKTRRTSSS